MNRLVSLAIAVLVAPLVPATGSAPADPCDNGQVRSNPADDANRNRLFDDLDARMAAAPEGSWEVIVHLVVPPDARTMDSLKRDLGGFVVTSDRDDAGAEGRPWTVIPAFATTLSRTQMEHLACHPQILHVQLDREANIFMGAAKTDSK